MSRRLMLSCVSVGVGAAMALSGVAGAQMDKPKDGAQPKGTPAVTTQSQKKEGDASKAAPMTGAELKQPLPTDPRLVTGTLPSGMSYIVVKHPKPPGRAVMWIHIATGSLNEKDNQRGIAHYLEHMAFNGSEHFPPGTVVDFFQQMGMTFGRDQNAFTSFDQTTYQLSLPDTKPETMEKGMRFFSDVAGHLSLTQEEIDRERQVILEEKRTRAGGRQRIQDYVLERLAPGSLLGERLPIGTEATLLKLTRPDFLDYYDKFYVPSNMTLVVVADEDTGTVVDQITKTFAGAEKKPKPADQDPRVTPTEGVRAIVASDKEITQASIELTRITRKEAPTTTVETMRRDLVREMGSMAFRRRIGAKLAKGGTAYLGARAAGAQMFNAAFSTSLSCDGEPGKWKEMLAEVCADLQRARGHGFTARELEDVSREIISGAERQVEQESTLAAGALIRRVNGALAVGDTIMSPQQELDLVKRLLPGISADEVGQTFAREFDFSKVVFVAEFPAGMAGGVPSESDVIAAGTKALDVKPEAETEAARPTELMSSAPNAGQVVSEEEHEATKVVSGWLENGVRFHYRFMDYEKDQVGVSISLAGGEIEETAADRGIAELASSAWMQPATSTLTSTNIRDIMTGKKAMARGRIGPDSLALAAGGSPADLEYAMQEAYLLLTDPVVEPAAAERWKTRQLRTIEQRKKTVEGVFGETHSLTVFPASDVRFQPLTAEQVNRATPAASQKWLRERIAMAPMEVTIVGDISKDEAMRLLKTYIGSLPKRERIGENEFASLRKLTRPKGPRTVEKTVDTETDKAQVAVGFYASDAKNITDTRNLLVASRMISTRMLKAVREEEQLAYSPRAGLSPGSVYPGFGMFALETSTKPTKTARLLEVAKGLFDDFAAKGPTEEELVTVKKQLAVELEEEMRKPSFWLARLQLLTYRGSNLDDIVGIGEYYQKLTGEQVQATFAKYYKPESWMTIVVKPARVKEDSEKAEPSASSDPVKKDVKPGS